MPSFTQSAQLGELGMTGSHVLTVGAQRPEVHVPLAQSASSLHWSPSGHGGHASPPQSTSVSMPSFLPSAQVGCAAPPVPDEDTAEDDAGPEDDA
jgi:hypothetical protein